MATDISVVINPPPQIDLTIGDGIPKHAETHAPNGSDSLGAYYVTGDVVRPSQTGSFVVSTNTGAFLTTGAADGRYYGLSSGQSISGYAFTGFNDAVTGMSITGSTTKTITLFQRDGTTITGSFSDDGGSGNVNVNDSNLIISISMFA